MRVLSTSLIGALLAGMAISGAAHAAGPIALIDRQLENEIDFRNIDYSVCASEPRCTVGEISINAQRRSDADDAWTDDALLYWDPVDGIGVEGGGQNDEIDFDERIVVNFGTSRTVESVWFSDFFNSEDSRYNAGLTQRVAGVPEDSEIAGMAFMLGDTVVFNQVASGADPLPKDSFNQQTSPIFAEGGDLLRRVIINDDVVTLIIPGDDITDRLKILEVAIGKIDKDKLDLFEGLETVQIDLKEIIGDFHRARYFAFGTRNFDQIASLLDNKDQLEAIKARAEILRPAIDVSNGEFLAESEFGEPVDRLVFFAPFDSSNDFSVAGIIMKPVSEAALAK